MGLMFCQFVVDRFESQLLGLVDIRAKAEIAEHFDLSQQADPSTRSIHTIGQAVLKATHDVVQNQTKLWRKSIQAAEQAWIESLSGANDNVQESLGVAVDESVGTLASYMSQAIERADVAMAHRWQQWQVSLSENARMMNQHHEELVRQSENVQKLLGNFGHADSFRSAIEQNQNALDATNKLHDTLLQLSSTIESLESRMDENSQATVALKDNWTKQMEQEQARFEVQESARQEMASRTADAPMAPESTSDAQEIYQPKTLRIPDFEGPAILNFEQAKAKRRAA